jgi:acylaminoacyl-peptidase
LTDFHLKFNIAQLITDIPDWVVCESLAQYDFDYKMNFDADFYAKLYEKSPIRHVDKVKTPILLIIGCMDLRVPPNQSIEYYKALIARGSTAK